jgi:DNA polymerase I-like protein with 3'-5' exonuclease and polymerase domains
MAGKGPVPFSDWQGPPAEFPRFDSGSMIGLDIETRDPELKKRGPGWAYPGSGEVIGVSLAWSVFDKAYWPVKHAGLHPDDKFSLPKAPVMQYFRDLLSRTDITIVVHNAQYDLGWLMYEGIEAKCRVIDTGIMAPLIDEHRYGYSLDDLSKSYLGEAGGKDEGELEKAAAFYGLDPKNEMWRIPSQFVGKYGERDARVTLDMAEIMIKEVNAQKLSKIAKLEHRLIPLLLAMRKQGIRIDHDYTHVVEKRWSAEIDKVRTTFGIEDAWSAEAVWAIAEKRPGVKPPERTAKTNAPSITQYWLADNSQDEFCSNVLKVRKLDKLLNTFLRGALMRYSDSATGRIYPQHNALRAGKEDGEVGGTVSGRFSASNPNVQQIPIRGNKELAIEIRRCMLPEVGMKWMSGDYSQQEPRLTVHYACMLGGPGAELAAARWWADPTIDYHQMVADMANVTRSHAKTIHLGLTYGMGEEALSNDLGLSITETRLLMKRYYEMVPFIPFMKDDTMAKARRDGYITTFAGRRCRFINNEMIHAAINRLIQGSAADQTKIAMLKLWDEHQLVPHVSMHDELCYSVPDLHFANTVVAEGMRTAIEMKVPALVDVEVGNNWGEASG